MSLLEKLSGISDGEKDKVAQVLDYQPLALAIAATYERLSRIEQILDGTITYINLRKAKELRLQTFLLKQTQLTQSQ